MYLQEANWFTQLMLRAHLRKSSLIWQINTGSCALYILYNAQEQINEESKTYLTYLLRPIVLNANNTSQ